jgi:putative transposase
VSHPEQIHIKKQMSVEELDKRIKTLEHNTRVLKRLYFIRHRYNGKSVEEACDLVGVKKPVGYIWQDRWNEEGYKGLIPRFAGGRPSKLSKEQKDRLLQLLEQKDNWTSEEVRDLVHKEFNVEYTLKQIRIILKNYGMRCAKPYVHDYRRPEDAEDILKKDYRLWMKM